MVAQNAKIFNIKFQNTKFMHYEANTTVNKASCTL